MELQINVDNNEYESFKNQHLRELWPPNGAYCNVPHCDKTQFFDTFNKYKEHFGRIHTATVKLFVCNLCHLSRRKVSDVKKHIKTQHKTYQNKLHQITVDNKDYVDNNDILPYRIGTQEERNEAVKERAELVKRKQKETEEEQEKRRKIADRCTVTHIEDKYYNARDERLQFDFSTKKTTMTRTVIRTKDRKKININLSFV